jgi:hypothetical protein
MLWSSDRYGIDNWIVAMRSEGVSEVLRVALKHSLISFCHGRDIDALVVVNNVHWRRSSLCFTQLGTSYHEQLSAGLSHWGKRSGIIIRDVGRLIINVIRYGRDCDFYWSRRPSELISALSLWTHALLSHVDQQLVIFVLSHLITAQRSWTWVPQHGLSLAGHLALGHSSTSRRWSSGVWSCLAIALYHNSSCWSWCDSYHICDVAIRC